MELELGLKVTRTREDVSSSVDFRFSKDPFGPLVLSQETNSRFIVIIHLKGFKKEGIEIEINEEGNRITIRGRKPVEEMVLIRWMAWRKEVEFRVFRKVFRIPDFVDLDKIKARFDDDDATLTITMPKRVKGISGFKIEEDEEEERMESGVVEEESIGREESDKQHSEFGERERHVLGEEQKDDQETENDNHIDEQDTNLECIQEEKELADSNKEVEDSSLRNFPDIQGRACREKTRDEEQELMVEQQAEAKRDDDFIRSRACEEIEDHEPHEQLDRTSESGATQKKTTDDDGDGLSKAQGIEEPEKQNEESKIQDLVAARETSGHEKKIKDDKDEVDGKMRQGFIPNTDITQVVGEDDIAEPEKNAEAFESDKLEADKVDKIHELAEKKEEEVKNGKMRRQSEDRNLKRLQENEEQHSKGQKRQDKQEEVKKLVEEKILKEKANIGKFFPKPVQETQVPTVDTLAKTGDERKERKEEKKSVDAKEEVDAEMGEGFAPNTDTEADKYESDQLKPDDADKIQKLVDMKEEEEENAKIGTQSEDFSLVKLQEIEEQQLQGQKRHHKQEKIRELVEEKTPKAEENIGNDNLKPVQETEVPEVDTLGKINDQGNEGKENKKIVKMDIENVDAKEEVDTKMGEKFKPIVARTERKAEEFESDKIQKLAEKKEVEEENANVGTQGEDISLRKIQEIGEQQLDEQKPHNKQEQVTEMVKEQTPEAETSIGNDISKPVQEVRVSELDTLKKTGDEGKEGNEKKQIVKMESNNGDAKENIDAKMGEAETETNVEEFGSDKVKADEVEKIQNLVEKEEENAKVGTQTEEIGEQQLKGQKRHDKQEKMKDLVKEQIPEAETSRGLDIPKPVQERCEEIHKIQKKFQEEKKNQPEEYKQKIMETGTKINDASTRKVQEIIRQQELDEPARGEKEKKTGESVNSKTNDEDTKEKETAERETKEQESYRPKILEEQEKIQELAEEKKTNFSKNGKFKEEEEIAEKQTDVGGDDDASRKVRDIKQRDSDAMKGKEEKEMIQELLLEEKVSDGGKEIIAVAEKKAENDKSKKVQEIVEQQPHEEDTFGKQFQKLIAGEISGHGEVGDVEKEKKTTEAEKIIKDSVREAREIEKKDADLSGKFVKGTTIQDLDENKGIYRNEHEEEKKDETDRPEKITGTTEQELDNLTNQLEEDNVEDGEKTQELVEKKTKDCEGGEVSKTKTDDDVVRKVQGITEQEVYEPEKEHVSKIKGLTEKKTDDHEKERVEEIEESEKEVECVSLQKVDGSEEQEFHEQQKHKEREKTRKTGTERPSGQEKEEEEEKVVESMTRTENENPTNVQEIKEEQPEELESHGKQYKIQEVVEAGQNDRKEEQNGEKVTAKAELETGEESSKKVPEIAQQEYDGLKRSMVQDKVQETEDSEKTRAMEEKEISERRTKTKDGGSLRKIKDDGDSKLNKPYHRKKEEKPKEVVEMGTSDYNENIKKQDEDDILRSQEASRPELDEFDRHSEERNIPQLVEEEKVENIAELVEKMEGELEEGKSHENLTHEEQEKREELVQVEATDPKDKHSSGEYHNDRKEKQQEEKALTRAELKTEENSSKKVQVIEKQETEEKDNNRAMEENKTVERRKQTKDGSLRKVREGEDPELRKPYKRQKADKIQEVVEMGTRDYREKVKKQDEDDVLRRQEVGRPYLGEQSNSPQLVKEKEKVENIAEEGRKMEDDSSSKFHEFEEGKTHENWTREEGEKRKDIAKEEATDPEDKHTGVESHNDHEEEEQEEKVIAKAEMETKEDSSKKVQQTEKQVNDELKRSMVQDKMQGTEENDNIRATEQNEIVERRKKTNDDRLKEVQESEDPKLDRHKRHGKEDMIQGLEETEKSDHRGKVKKKDKDDILRSQETGKMVVLGELERHRKQRKIHQSVEDENEEKKIENISEPGEKWKGDSSGNFHEFQNQKSFEDWKQEEIEEIENLVEEEATGPKDQHTGGRVGEHTEERYEKVAQNKTKVGNEINKVVGEDKEKKEERYRKLDKLEGVLSDGASDCEKEEKNLVDDTTKIQQTEKNKESFELEMHEKLDVVPDFVKSKTGDQEDEEAKESAVVVASNENGSSRKNQMIEDEEPVRHKAQKKIPETSDPEVKEEDKEIVAKKETKEEVPNSRNVGETKELEAHVQGKTMSPERSKTKTEDGIVRKNRETKVQNSNEKNKKEGKGETEELERKESSNREVNLVKDDSLRKGQEFLEKESDVSKRRPVKQVKNQEVIQKRVNDDDKNEKAETKINDGKSRNFEMSKLLEMDKSKDNEERKTTRKSIEEKSNAPEIEKEGNEKIAEEKMQDKIDCRIKDQEFIEEEPFEHDQIPEYHREDEKGMEERKIEEMKRTNENASSRKVQTTKAQESDGLENQRKLSEIQENGNMQELVEEEEMSESGGHEAVLKTKSQDVEENRSDQPKRYAEQENSQDLIIEDRKKEYHIREEEQNEKAKRDPQVESKSNDDKPEKSETEDNESTKLIGQKKKENHQQVVEIETSHQRKEEKDEEIAGKGETIHEYDSSMKTHEHEEQKSDKMSKKLAEEETRDDNERDRAGQVWKEGETKIKDDGFGKVREIEEQEQEKKQSYLENDTSSKTKDNKNQETKRRDDSSGNKTQENEKQESHEQKRNEEDVVGKAETITDRSRKIHEHDERKLEKMSEIYAEEDTSNDKEAKGNRAGAVLGEDETKTGKVRETEEQEHDKKQSLEKDTRGKAKDNENQETKSRDDSSGNTQRHENQESHEQKGNEEQDKKNLGLVGKKSRNEEDGKEDGEFGEAEVLRNLKGAEKQESTRMVEKDENRDSINELVEEKTRNQGGEDKKSMITEVLAKAENLEWKGPEGEKKQDKSRKQKLRDNLKDAETETNSKDNEPRKIHQIKEQEETSEQERLTEQGKIKELVKVRTQYYREIENRETECGDGSSKKIQEKDKEKSIEPGSVEKQDKIQEPVDRETREEDDEEEEELEVEFEDEEEDWEAEVIQEMDSDEDNDKIRQIKRIRLGFRLLGGSTLFMSLIVIVIRFIRSKRKIRCYKL